MCGIIGVYLNKVTDEQKQKIIKLILESGIRGVHATGLSHLKDGKIITYSDHLSSKDFLEGQSMDDFVDSDGGLYMIAHTRYSTSDLRYNQPIGDENLAICHNGVISQEPPKTWKKTFGLTTKTSNDSELIYALLKNKEDPLVKFQGSMAVCILDTISLVAFRNHERPLWYSLEKNGIIFASTKNILKRSGFKKPEKCEMFHRYFYTDNSLLISPQPIPAGVKDLQ